MGNKTLSVLAAALFAASVGTSQPACVSVQGRVMTALEQRDARIRDDLDSILESVHCVRTSASYRLEGADASYPEKTRTAHGTAFAYMRKGGYTYLVTNAHVVDEPEQITKQVLDIGPEGLGIVTLTYSRSDMISWLVEDDDDSDESDDVQLELVAKHAGTDIAVVRTRKVLQVSDAYSLESDVRQDIGEEVYVVGYPGGVLPAVTKGIVSNDGHEFSGGHVLETLDAAATFGNSGSPYFLSRGGRLVWGGLMSKVLLHSGGVAYLPLTIPLGDFSDMISDPEAYAAAHATADEEAAETSASPDVVGGGV